MNSENLLDPVYIINQYAIFSSAKDDVLFYGERSNEPIFCGGQIRSFEKNVFGFKKGDFVAYISYEQNLNISLSSNLIFKLKEMDAFLLFILPYASYALKILRKVNPKLGKTILIIGVNFFSMLLFHLFRLSGADVYIIKNEEQSNLFEINSYVKKYNLSIKKSKNILSFKAQIHEVLIISELNQEIIKFLDNIHEKLIKKQIWLITNYQNINYKDYDKLKFDKISRFDVGFEDLKYKMGLKYPYNYIRWDYKRNIEYFIELVENKRINLDFLKITPLNFKSLKPLMEFIKTNKEKKLFFFKIGINGF